MTSPMGRSVQLGFSGRRAEIVADDVFGGWALLIGGTEQSHVDLEEPTTVRHEYLRRIAHVLDSLRPQGTPIRIAHLGAGALTLARYVQATRPGSTQTVIEIERELVDFVRAQLPLPAGTDLTALVGDAREVIGRLDGGFEAIVVDVFSGEASPGHLTEAAFFGELLDALAPDGALIVNIGDDAGLAFAGTQLRRLEEQCAARGLDGVRVLLDATLLELRREGNLVLVAGGGIDPSAAERWQQAGPHPAAVLDPDAAADLARRIAGH
ncbi:MAG: fused MFS/spermidine synthase [Brachybacterium sp.]|nr:fused MFS/spermidine synthase [Brachybacterium sp.]